MSLIKRCFQYGIAVGLLLILASCAISNNSNLVSTPTPQFKIDPEKSTINLAA